MAATVTKIDAGRALRDYDETFLNCRDLRHPWRVLGYFKYAGEIHRRLVCTRCDTERTDIWSSRAERIATRYNHPDGYLLKGSGGIATQDIRKEVVKRVTVFRNEDDMIANVFTKANGRKRA